MGIQVTWCSSFSWLEKGIDANTKNEREFKIHSYKHL